MPGLKSALKQTPSAVARGRMGGVGPAVSQLPSIRSYCLAYNSTLTNIERAIPPAADRTTHEMFGVRIARERE